MSAPTGLREPGSPITLYEHARQLHEVDPDRPLPRAGRPYPDEERHRAVWERLHRQWDRRTSGADAAAVLDAFFARPGAHASELADAFLGLDVPSNHDDHIAAAARRADPERVRQTGRWLVRHSTDRDAATVGLALLETDPHQDDVPLIRTIGLLCDHFAELAARALRRAGGDDALLWLARRSSGWGRVAVVEELCSRDVSRTAREWLLRHACDGHHLDGYVAGEVATRAHLHAAITADDPDEALVDHTGRLLLAMCGAENRGTPPATYPPARALLTPHVGHHERPAPPFDRWFDAVRIADHLIGAPRRLASIPPERRDVALACRYLTPDEEAALGVRYLAVARRPDWLEAARAGLVPDDFPRQWLTDGAAARLGVGGCLEPPRTVR